MNRSEILEKLTGSSAVGRKLAAGELGSVAVFVARLVLASAAFALALLLDSVTEPWVTVILAAAALVAGCDVIISAVFGVMRGDWLNRELLTCAAALLAFLFGAAVEGCALILLYQIAGVFIDYAVERTRRSVLDTIICDTPNANRMENGREATVPASELSQGDTIIIRTGETVPCDCLILEGESRVDRAPLGDASGVVEAHEGDRLLSGCVNLGGELRCEVFEEQRDSAATRLYRRVEGAPRRGEALPELLLGVKRYLPAVITVLAVLIAALPPVFSDVKLSESIRRAAMFLVIASPVSMLAAVPVIRLSACCGAARAGILFDSNGAMDAMASAGTVAFAQTGTITEGRLHVTDVKGERMDRETLLKIAAHALTYMNTPEAQAIREAYGERVDLDLVADYSTAPGYGIEVRVGGIPIRVGNRALMQVGHVDIPARDLYVEDGDSCVYVAITDEYAGCIVLSDTVADGAADAVGELRRTGVENVVMLSPGTRDRAASLAAGLGITEYYSECGGEKVKTSLSSLKQALAPGRSLVFVGTEGDFTGPHTAADVDIAMADAETLTRSNSCDVIIMGGGIGKISEAIGISRYARMLSLVTAAGAGAVKLILLVLAAFGISTLWFTVFIDAIAAVAAALVSILAFSGELYGSGSKGKK